MLRPALLLIFALAATAASADDFDVLPDELPGGPKGHLLRRSLLAENIAALDRRTKDYEKIKTEDEARAYQQKMRAFFLERLGGLPERTPLNAYRAGRLERDGYSVEKIVFESRPNVHVTGLLFLPPGKGPFPGVIVPCGHSANGKAETKYQRACILMAKNNIAAFIYDPFGQGERHQVLKPDGTTAPPNHTILGVSCIPLGTGFAQFRIWDGMRALDYLASRPEVDPARLGCTGNSGGGTLTSYLMALDDRIACAAPSCYITSMQWLLERQGPQDAEQNIFGQVAFGLTQSEFAMMRAPKPTLLCTATKDMFRIEGSWDVFRENKRFYARFGLPERVDLVETDEGHGFHLQLREGSARWMQRWLGGIDKPIVEPEFEVLTDAEALCTEKGQVLHLPNERTLFDVNADAEDRLAETRRKLWSEKSASELLSQVRQLANVRPLAKLPKPKVDTVGEPISRDGYELRKLTLTFDGGLILPAFALVPTKPSGDAVLYVDGEGKRAAADDAGELAQLARNGTIVVAVDLPGLGELHDPKSVASGGMPGRTDWQTYFLGYLVERSLVGLWAENVLQATHWLSTYEMEKQRRPVRIVGVGLAGPAVLHAAALEPKLCASVELRAMLDSWSSVVRDRRGCGMQLLNTVHGALRVYDLPDLRRVIGSDKLTVVDPRDSQNEPLSSR